MAKAKYHLLNEPGAGKKAEQLGLVSLAVDEAAFQETALSVATRLAGSGRPQYSGHHSIIGCVWQVRTFDASLALETLGFSGPDPVEGLASFRDRRPPSFSRKVPF